MSDTGILQRLFGKKEIRTEYVSVDDTLLKALNIKTDTETALNIPAVSACVDFICGKIAELPIKLFKDSLDGKTQEITDDNRVRLLNDVTGDLLDPYQMKAAVVRDYLLSGTGYIYPERYRNKTVSLRYIDTNRVSAVKNSDPIFKVAKYIVGDRTFVDDEIIRICRNSRDGVKGVGIIDEHSELLSAAYKEIVYERYLVETGGNKKGFLQTEKTVSPDVVRQIKSDWEKLYSGSGSGIVVLNNGLKFTESSNTSVEMQLNENKTKNNELICQMFGLSSKVVSGTASDDEYVTAIKTAVMPICAAFQAALNKDLLLPSEREEYYFAFDMKQLLKGDILKRYQAYQIALQSRFMQPNEVRYEEDLEPYEYDFITLGLSDVLLDLKNKTIYTPNTNKTVKFGENNGVESVENSVKSGIIEERSNDGSHYTKDEHGQFTGSTGSGGGSGGGSAFNENSKKPITPITDEAIEKVPNVSISGYTDEQCTFIQQQHKELLKYSRDNNSNKEFAFVFNGDLKNKKEFKGSDDKLDFGNSLYGKDLFVMHNHPRNSSYSMNDVVEFVSNDSIKTLTIVKNNGRIETLTKINSCDKVKMITDLGRLKKKNVKTGSDKELDKTVKDFLTKNVKGGTFEWQN